MVSWWIKSHGFYYTLQVALSLCYSSHYSSYFSWLVYVEIRLCPALSYCILWKLVAFQAEPWTETLCFTSSNWLYFECKWRISMTLHPDGHMHTTICLACYSGHSVINTLLLKVERRIFYKYQSNWKQRTGVYWNHIREIRTEKLSDTACQGEDAIPTSRIQKEKHKNT